MNNQKRDVSMAQLSELILPLLEQGTDVELTATGNSMRPLWRHKKDVIKLTAVDIQNIKKWDVLLFRRESGAYVLHRVVKVRENVVDFLGDGQFSIEKDIPKSQILAKVKGYKRNGGEYKSVENLGYKAYVFIWYKTYHLRFFAYRVFNKIKKIFGAK